MSKLTISGAYGRDYKSKAAIESDLAADKDFVIRTFGPNDGSYVNATQLREMGLATVEVRYKADRSVTVCKVPGPKVADPTGEAPRGWREVD